MHMDMSPAGGSHSIMCPALLTPSCLSVQHSVLDIHIVAEIYGTIAELVSAVCRLICSWICAHTVCVKLHVVLVSALCASLVPCLLARPFGMLLAASAACHDCANHCMLQAQCVVVCCCAAATTGEKREGIAQCRTVPCIMVWEVDVKGETLPSHSMSTSSKQPVGRLAVCSTVGN